MRTKAHWILFPALGLALALGTAWSLGFAGTPQNADDDPMPGMMGMPMPSPPSWQEQLGLTEEQMTKLRALHFENAKSGLRARSDVLLKRLELEELLQADEPDKAALDQKLRALSDARAVLLRQQIENRLAVRRLLTPEQRTKLRQLLMQRRHLRMQGRQRPFAGPSLGGPRGRGFGPSSDLDFDLEPETPPQE